MSPRPVGKWAAVKWVSIAGSECICNAGVFRIGVFVPGHTSLGSSFCSGEGGSPAKSTACSLLLSIIQAPELTPLLPPPLGLLIN